MKKYRLEIIIFLVNAVYMILELVASRVLSPYFGSSNIVWTSVIGIILLSNSIGNYLGGKIADKGQANKNIKLILSISGIMVLVLPLIQKNILSIISSAIGDSRIGAIIGTILLFFLPSMFIGFLSPIIIKAKLNNLEKAGEVSGIIYAISTFGGIVGTFLGGFFLLPAFGSTITLFILSIVLFALVFFLEGFKFSKKKYIIINVVLIVINISMIIIYSNINKINSKLIEKGDTNAVLEYDTQYGKVRIYSVDTNNGKIRAMEIDKGNESATYTDLDKRNELVFDYTKYYDLMFESGKEIKDTLMIGGAGYSYPKYFISKYLDKNMDVVEIDEKVTELAKQYFYLNESDRLNLITEDGRTYLNKNTKKYDAILNDAFSGNSPAEILTTIEAAEKVHNSLNENGVYLTNIISSVDGKNSKFIKAEINTLKQVFKNVYAVPCNYKNDNETVQNIMVIATDSQMKLENEVKVNIPENEIILTDDRCPVDNLIPIID